MNSTFFPSVRGAGLYMISEIAMGVFRLLGPSASGAVAAWIGLAVMRTEKMQAEKNNPHEEARCAKKQRMLMNVTKL